MARHSVRAELGKSQEVTRCVLPALPFAIVAVRASRYAPRVDLPVRKKLPHTVPQWVAEGSWFFITINCVPPGKNQLCRAHAGDAVLAAMKFNHERFVWHCRVCLLMPDYANERRTGCGFFVRMTGRRRCGVDAKRRARSDAPYRHGTTLQKLSRKLDRSTQEAQIMAPRNFTTAKLLKVRREPL